MKAKYAIRKQVANPNSPEEQGELISTHLTYEDADAMCSKGFYVCDYEEPVMPATRAVLKQPFNK